MGRIKYFGMMVLLVSLWTGGGAWAGDHPVSGRVENGIRVLGLDPDSTMPMFTVFRGDPLKLDIRKFTAPPSISLPSLGINGVPDPDLPYHFKVREVGKYVFIVNGISGQLRVVEYSNSHYEAVSVDRAAGLIRDPEVLILDVRTPGEYGRGRIPGSKLIPIRQLQARLDELLPHKDKPILVYCASGNRSTVGSKVLVDQGFARVYNLRRGIKAWQSKGFTMER